MNSYDDFFNKPVLPFIAKGKLYYLTSEEKHFLKNIAEILNVESFAVHIKVQQVPLTDKYAVNSILFLFQPFSTRPEFYRLQKLLRFGELVRHPDDRSFAMFRIRSISNIEVFFELIKQHLDFSNSFFDYYMDIMRFRKIKEIGEPENFIKLLKKVDNLNKKFSELCIDSPRDLTPEYIKSRLCAGVL